MVIGRINRLVGQATPSWDPCLSSAQRRAATGAAPTGIYLGFILSNQVFLLYFMVLDA
jgi:hypothetical protein